MRWYCRLEGIDADRYRMNAGGEEEVRLLYFQEAGECLDLMQESCGASSGKS